MTLRKRSCPAVSQICREAAPVRAGRGNPLAGDAPVAPNPTGPPRSAWGGFPATWLGIAHPLPKLTCNFTFTPSTATTLFCRREGDHVHQPKAHFGVGAGQPPRGAGCAPAPRLLSPSQRDEARLPTGLDVEDSLLQPQCCWGGCDAAWWLQGHPRAASPPCQGGKWQNQALVETGQQDPSLLWSRCLTHLLQPALLSCGSQLP